MSSCSKCETYKQEAEKYKSKYELAKSGLSEDERKLLIELICNEQLMHVIPKIEGSYESEIYNKLEQLKVKIKTV